MEAAEGLRLGKRRLFRKGDSSRLKLSQSTVNRDIAVLRAQAKDDIRKNINEQVPFEFQKALAGLQDIIENMANIITASNDNLEIMAASSLKMQAYNMKMELVSNSNLVEKAIDLVEKYHSLGRGYRSKNDKVRIDDPAADGNDNSNDDDDASNVSTNTNAELSS